MRTIAEKGSKQASLGVQRDGQTISYQVAVVEKQDLQGRLADLVAKEQSKVPQLGILLLTFDDNLRSMLPPLRKHAGVIVACRESEGAYLGERLLPGDVIYAVSGTPVYSVDSLRSAQEGVKSADAIALQVERLGTLHYLVLETDNKSENFGFTNYRKRPNGNNRTFSGSAN